MRANIHDIIEWVLRKIFVVAVFVWRFREMKKTIEELLQSPYWVIDILPLQVPKDSPKQYFAIEKYFLQDKQFAEVKQKHINLILKLNCLRKLKFPANADGGYFWQDWR